MAFTGNEEHDITLEQASNWTENYRDANPNEIKAHYFGGSAIMSVLNQEGCVGIRIYYALNDDNEKQLVIVGVRGNENDIDEGILLDRSVICPPTCGAENDLNS